MDDYGGYRTFCHSRVRARPKAGRRRVACIDEWNIYPIDAHDILPSSFPRIRDARRGTRCLHPGACGVRVFGVRQLSWRIISSANRHRSSIQKYGEGGDSRSSDVPDHAKATDTTVDDIAMEATETCMPREMIFQTWRVLSFALCEEW